MLHKQVFKFDVLKTSVTRFGIFQYNFDLCTCQEQEILFL